MNRLKRILLLLAGINLVALSINLFLSASFGSDPLTVLQQGMHLVLGISVGQSSLLYNTAILVFALVFAKKGLGLGTAAYILLLGIFIDGYSTLFDLLLPPALSITVRLLLFAIGQLAIPLGFALVIHVKLGTNGLDALLLALERKLGASYRSLRTMVDVLFTLLGAFLGGVVGLGTVISMLTTGWMVSWFLRRFSQ